MAERQQERRVNTRWCEWCNERRDIEEFPRVAMCSEGRIPICERHRTNAEVLAYEANAKAQLLAAGLRLSPPIPLVRGDEKQRPHSRWQRQPGGSARDAFYR